MPSNFLPSREAQLVTWGRNFQPLIAADPAAYGLTAEQASAYTTVHTAFDSAYQTANDPGTRSPSNIAIKNTAKRSFIADTRKLVKIIQAFPGLTNGQRSNLGITVPDLNPTPVPPPTVAPQLDVVAVSGRRMTLRLRDAETGERKKPAGVQSATVLSYVGETVPDVVRDWSFEGNTSKPNIDVVFGETVPMGAKVWLAAFWSNRRGESGPACSPISAHVGFGALTQAA